jgi:hypothetical protein
MKILTSVPIEFYDLRKKLTAEMLSIGKSSEVYKQTISLSGMAEIMGISKEMVLPSLNLWNERTISSLTVRGC